MADVYNAHLDRLRAAFDQDGFEPVKIVTRFGKTGILAEHKTAVNYQTGQRKRVYYLEGGHYEMGYLMGLMAEPEVARMTQEFADNLIFAFFGVSESLGRLGEPLVRLVIRLAKFTHPDIPPELHEEMRGLLDGCRESNPHTRVDEDHLAVLNYGADILCALAYTGDFLFDELPELRAHEVQIPIMCNGFAVFGQSTGGGHYFGRDFMFPTAGVFQDTACMVIYNHDQPFLSMVGVTAPGFVGSVAAMNINGVGIGVDMAPSGNCNPHRVGINSLLLVRHGAQSGGGARGVVDLMADAVRGVSWDYIVADGANDEACIVEAGCSMENPAYLEYPGGELLPFLPDQAFIDGHKSTEFRNGLVARWHDYQYPQAYLAFNEGLWHYYNQQKRHHQKTLHPDAFAEKGYINRGPDEKNCPSLRYFAPQRETKKDVVLASNHYVVPEMRLFGMYPWTVQIASKQADDIQWRYDELNRRILDAIEANGYIDYAAARELIDFLAPYGQFPQYYEHSPKSADGKATVIQGSVSLFDLKKKTVETHVGYYEDAWIKLTLPNYIAEVPAVGQREAAVAGEDA